MERKDIPYIVYEGTMSRFERIIKRLILVLMVLIMVLILSNAWWIHSYTTMSATPVVESEICEE